VRLAAIAHNLHFDERSLREMPLMRVHFWSKAGSDYAELVRVQAEQAR